MAKRAAEPLDRDGSARLAIDQPFEAIMCAICLRASREMEVAGG